MKKGNTDRRKFIVSLFIIVLSLGVGYAIFSETINITGTAQTSGSFNIEFFDADPSLQALQEAELTTNTATISGDKNLLTLNIPALERPGSWVEFDVTIKNVGTIGALLEAVTIIGDTDANIKVTNTLATEGLVLAAGATDTFKIKVEWITTGNDDGGYTSNESLNFSFELDYKQDY